jgi:hypothetical protein
MSRGSLTCPLTLDICTPILFTISVAVALPVDAPGPGTRAWFGSGCCRRGDWLTRFDFHAGGPGGRIMSFGLPSGTSPSVVKLVRGVTISRHRGAALRAECAAVRASRARLRVVAGIAASFDNSHGSSEACLSPRSLLQPLMDGRTGWLRPLGIQHLPVNRSMCLDARGTDGSDVTIAVGCASAAGCTGAMRTSPFTTSCTNSFHYGECQTEYPGPCLATRSRLRTPATVCLAVSTWMSARLAGLR